MKQVFIIGGGPSAASVDFNSLKSKGLIVAVNDSYKKLPFVDEIFTADGSWLVNRKKQLRSFEGTIVAALPNFMKVPAIKRLKVVRRLDGVGLGDKTTVHYADNSGFGAVVYYVAQGYKDIYLIGYDLKEAGHWHGGYEWKSRIGADRYPGWIRSFEELAVMIRQQTTANVYNTNPDSGIRGFPFVRIEDVKRTRG